MSFSTRTKQSGANLRVLATTLLIGSTSGAFADVLNFECADQKIILLDTEKKDLLSSELVFTIQIGDENRFQIQKVICRISFINRSA